MYIYKVYVYEYVHVYAGFIFACIYLGIVFTNKHVWVSIFCFDYIISHVRIKKEKKCSKQKQQRNNSNHKNNKKKLKSFVTCTI